MTTQTVYYDSKGNAYVQAEEIRRIPAAGEWIVVGGRAVRCNAWYSADVARILRPALPHEDPRRVPACMTREGQTPRYTFAKPRAKREERESGASPNEAFFAALREYVDAVIAVSETPTIKCQDEVAERFAAEVRAERIVLERFNAAVDARVDEALARLEAQQRKEAMDEGERAVWGSFLHASDADTINERG
jgi:hypothetical protein